MTGSDVGLDPLLGCVLAAFTSSGVAWAVLRGREDLVVPGGDVDLLVAPAHQPLAQEIIFALGGVPRPEPRFPWHRMYVFDVPGPEAGLKLDIVNRLVYHRDLQIASGLEDGVLDRRVREEPLVTLAPTDAFWTILLHCVVDKQSVREARAQELTEVVTDLTRPSPGEDFFDTLCPPGWSPQRAIDCVVAGDWRALGRLAELVLSRRRAQQPSSRAWAGPVLAADVGRRVVGRLVTKAACRPTTGGAYFAAWRTAGLVTVPGVLDVVEATGVDATVVGLTRRPGSCRVVLVVEDERLPRLLTGLRGDYRCVAGGWRRLGPSGLESVHVLPTSETPRTPGTAGGPWDASLPLPGRRHCRLGLAP